MLDGIKSFFDRRISTAEPEVEDPSAAVQLAACALLLELAHADGDFGPEERQAIDAAVRRHFGLDDATAGELVRLAESERRQAVDQFQFARLITEHYDLGQRMVLAEVMWGVILADGKIADHEASLMQARPPAQLQPAYLAQARRAAGDGRRGG
ncbi:MAG: TerB family tellurite resistance protein [Gemmatimonadales bacterium]